MSPDVGQARVSSKPRFRLMGTQGSLVFLFSSDLAELHSGIRSAGFLPVAMKFCVLASSNIQPAILLPLSLDPRISRSPPGFFQFLRGTNDRSPPPTRSSSRGLCSRLRAAFLSHQAMSPVRLLLVQCDSLPSVFAVFSEMSAGPFSFLMLKCDVCFLVDGKVLPIIPFRPSI